MVNAAGVGEETKARPPHCGSNGQCLCTEASAGLVSRPGASNLAYEESPDVEVETTPVVGCWG